MNFKEYLNEQTINESAEVAVVAAVVLGNLAGIIAGKLAFDAVDKGFDKLEKKIKNTDDASTGVANKAVNAIKGFVSGIIPDNIKPIKGRFEKLVKTDKEVQAAISKYTSAKKGSVLDARNELTELLSSKLGTKDTKTLVQFALKTKTQAQHKYGNTY